MKFGRIFLIALLIALAVQPASSAPGSFKIIVHSSNGTGSMSRGQLASIFLKKTTRWQNGAVIAPVDLVDDTGTRQEFSRYVLNKAVSAVKSFWQQQIFSGRDVPPVEKRTDDEVIAFVRANPNAIGYVSGAARIAGVKTIELTD